MEREGYEFVRSGIGERVAAYVADGMVLSLGGFLVMGASNPWFALLGITALAIGYPTLFAALGYQTVGRLLLGLTVCYRRTKTRASAARMAVRACAGFIIASGIPATVTLVSVKLLLRGENVDEMEGLAIFFMAILLGLVSSAVVMAVQMVVMARDSERRAIHDRVAGTVVLQSRRLATPAPAPTESVPSYRPW